MTVNMNGHTNVQERRGLLSKIIRRKDKGSSLVFCQELPTRFESRVVPDDYGVVRTVKPHAAVMWSKQHFRGKKVDPGFKTNIFDKLPDTMKEIDDIVSEIPGRTAVAKLTAIEESCNFLAASWHGPHSGKTLEKKQKALKGLILFLHEVCRRMKDVSLIIIGGDFNLNTLNENELNVYFPCYRLSDRANEHSKDHGNYIPYKDNFAITTTSPNVVSPFEGMNLSEVKPLLEFVYVKQEGNEEKDILDHDPIIGFLQLGKTPSTGKFWLVRQRFTWPLATKPCLKLIVTYSVLLEISRCLVESVIFIVETKLGWEAFKRPSVWRLALSCLHLR